MTAELDGSNMVRGQSEAAQAQGVRTWTTTMPASPRAAWLAREATWEALLTWHLTHLHDTAALLASELVSNAVIHANANGAEVELRLHASHTELCIEVQDPDPCPPHICNPDGFDETGRGLLIVEAISNSWGVRALPTGKIVWAELGIEMPPEPTTDDERPARALDL